MVTSSRRKARALHFVDEWVADMDAFGLTSETTRAHYLRRLHAYHVRRLDHLERHFWRPSIGEVVFAVLLMAVAAVIVVRW